MNGHRKSDGPIVSGKPLNNGSGAPLAAEGVERRGPAKGNPGQQTRQRTQRRRRLQQALERIRQVAEQDKGARFTALWHHVYDVDRLCEAYLGLKRSSAAGVDGKTWRQYGEALEENLEDLAERLKRGAYRARPVRRVYIPKADGRQRPIGVPTLEDKIVQRATTEVLNAVYEVDFLGFSYGFRPGRGQHDALAALAVGIQGKKVSWVLDADIRGFFDAINHEWLVKFIEHRIADQRVVRHIKKWLKAGVLEDGEVKRQKEGTPQGGSISPLLANVYLHYAFDLWLQKWRKTKAQGDVVCVRYADDFVVGFQHRWEAERFRSELEERLRRFGLELHPEKTRLLQFGRFAAQNRASEGLGKPETFDFLGFTHICAKSRAGKFQLRRKTMRRRLRAKCLELRTELRRRLHRPIPETGQWLRRVLQGHYRYFGVPLNSRSLAAFRYRVLRLWRQALLRRSQKHRLPWTRMARLAAQWLPPPRICLPWPSEILRVNTQGRSPVR